MRIYEETRMSTYFNDILLDKISGDHESTTRVDVATNEKLKFNFHYSTVDEALYNYSKQYFNAAVLIIKMIAEKSGRNDVTDQCPIGMLYFLRHSVELMLKALIYKQNKSQAPEIFSNCKHALTLLHNHVTYKFVCQSEIDLMENYFAQIDEIDSMGDLFRYPFDEDFLKKYHQKFFDFYDMFYVYALYYEYLHWEFTETPYIILDVDDIKVAKESRDSKNNSFIIEAPHGIGYFMIWETNNDHPSFNQIEGYQKIGKYLYHHVVNNPDDKSIQVPLMFAYRHLIEISMKNFSYKIHSHFKDEIEDLAQKNGRPSFKLYRDYMRCHELHKKLFDNVEACLKYLATQFNWSQQEIDDYKARIEIIKNCDPKAEKFRYPINKGCQMFDYPIIYIDSFCKLCEQCFEITDNCSYAFEDMKDWYLEIMSELYQEYGNSEWY